ncbi:MAG: S8 family peptidase [Bacteroidota bacterium]
MYRQLNPLKGNKGFAFIAAAISLLAVGCKKNFSAHDAAATTASRPATPADTRAHVPNELLVKFKPSANASNRANALAKVSGLVSEKVLTKAMQHAGDNEGFVIVHTSLNALDAISKLKGDAEIEFAEPNYIYTHTAVATDPYFTNGSLWGMSSTNTYGSQAATAWAAGHTGSSSIAVGVIDEGIQFNHPDLNGQVWTNPYDPIDGIDNDGNGYKDDVHGWDFASNDNSIYDGGNSGKLDDHGTHVSGTIGGKANIVGVAGMNWNITIISAKFLGRSGGTTANAIKAVDYLTTLKNLHPELNIVASNNSWGGGGFSQALSDAITRSNNKNILFIAAAGNGGSDGVGDNNDAVANYPSNYPQANVIAVAAITSTGARSSFSNYGTTTVDIGAPGSAIMSTTAYNLYQSYSGTSMATPHVTGAAALFASTHPGATAAEIKAAILNSATPTTSLAGKSVTGGRLNVSGF